MKVGQFAEERLVCGCLVKGIRHSSKAFDGDFERVPCEAHTELGACSFCRDGIPHPLCSGCGLSDGRHASSCEVRP